MESINHYKDGKKDGNSIEYHRDGGKFTEEVYKNGKLIKQIGEWEYEEMKDYVPPRDSEFL